MLTRVFKSGNSLAIRIPKELAIADVADEVEIERIGNSLVVRPAHRRSLSGIAEIFSLFSPDFMSGGREFHEELEREWDEPIQRPGQGLTHALHAQHRHLHYLAQRHPPEVLEPLEAHTDEGDVVMSVVRMPNCVQGFDARRRTETVIGTAPLLLARRIPVLNFNVAAANATAFCGRRCAIGAAMRSTA